jgi:hypothetical protein
MLSYYMCLRFKSKNKNERFTSCFSRSRDRAFIFYARIANARMHSSLRKSAVQILSTLSLIRSAAFVGRNRCSCVQARSMHPLRGRGSSLDRTRILHR